MSEQEREKVIRETETDPDVEGHKVIRRSGEAEPKEGEAEKRPEGDEPDVEAHKIQK